MSQPITITRFSKRHVSDNNGYLFNVNNSWADNDEAEPDDYYDVLRRTETKNWVAALKPDYLHYLDFDKEDTDWMLQALNGYAMMIMVMNTEPLQAAVAISKLYKEQLDKTVAKHAAKFPPGNWFVRVERVSLKSGVHGAGPYTNLKNIIQSIITSKLGHECISLDDDLDDFRIYLFPWVTIEHEFRVFVYQNRISAMSTQHLDEVDQRLATMTDDDLRVNIIDKIVAYFNDNLKETLKPIVGPNYTIDIAILEDGSVYFIEPNGFGANYAAGSSLFHWQINHNTLCKTEGEGIEFRFIDRE